MHPAYASKVTLQAVYVVLFTYLSVEQYSLPTMVSYKDMQTILKYVYNPHTWISSSGLPEGLSLLEYKTQHTDNYKYHWM